MLSPFGDMVGESSAFDEFGLALRQVTSVTMQSDMVENEKIPASLIDAADFRARSSSSASRLRRTS
jgi:hypothetical protein